MKRGIFKAETDRATITIVPKHIRLGRELTQEEIDEVLQQVNLVNYRIASRLYKEGKLATNK
ncbi:hypothetical protein [Paraclostridium bifermentans]|uniref:hypothetical protein n=1 Tax=Paraclostridium bifermentans TaxID=1490 RepID=UPI00124348C7|nr:hypothetical protein [Paraclostridium bifermentans]